MKQIVMNTINSQRTDSSALLRAFTPIISVSKNVFCRTSMKKKITLFLLTAAIQTMTIQANTYVFSTSDSVINPPLDMNHGWWSDIKNNSSGNVSYAVGADRRPGFTGIMRGFFTFDLSSISGHVTSATLRIQKGIYGSTDPSETLGLFDVTTDAVTLNKNTGTSSTIFNDLGGGNSYGVFEVPAYNNSFNEFLELTLNSQALSDINSSRGTFFSIGASLLTLNNTENMEFLFSGGPSYVMLEVETSNVPDGGNNALFLALGLVFLCAFPISQPR